MIHKKLTVFLYDGVQEIPYKEITLREYCVCKVKHSKIQNAKIHINLKS